MAATAGLLRMQHAAPGADVLRITRAQRVAEAQAVAMGDAALQQVADDLDAGMRMRLVADAPLAMVAVVIEEDERAQRDPVVHRQCAPQPHVAVIDHAVGRDDRFDIALAHGGLTV